MKKQLLIASALMSAHLAQAAEFEVSGYVGFEWREHFEEGQFNNVSNEQADRQLGFTAEPEMVWSLAEGEHTIVFKPYARIDSADDERSHGDIRELSWMTYGDDWEVTAGISKVYWGVTESQHLVDIVNQTDFVEAPDGEDKLGQPMVKLSLIRDWGTVTWFVLPGFRERTFPGEEGRFRTALPISSGDAEYQAGEEDAHVDYAARWNHTIEDYDLGLSWFNGTSRDPLFVPTGFKFPAPGITVPTKLSPFYVQINQVGLDLQATLDSWLWKFEAIYRSYDDSAKNSFADFGVEDYTAATGGFEYTFYGPFETVWDWGVLAEYQYDSREDAALAIGQNDAFLGSRIAFNDTASSQVLAGISQDLDSANTQSFVMEFSTRINEGMTLNVDAFLLMSDDDENVSYQFKRDDYVQLSLNYYY
jgi:hypothetical protein